MDLVISRGPRSREECSRRARSDSIISFEDVRAKPRRLLSLSLSLSLSLFLSGFSLIVE